MDNYSLMPRNEDSLSSEDFFGLDEVLLGVLSVVGDLGNHVVNVEGLRHIVSVVSIGHSLEVKSHSGASLDVSELEEAGGGVAVGVEELGDSCFVLREVRVVGSSVPLLVVVDDVPGLGVEERRDFLVLLDGIEKPDFIEGWLHSSVSDSGNSEEREEEEVDLPEESLVGHEEAESSIADEGSSPSIV